MAVALLSFKAGATDETSISEPIINDSLATIVEETEEAINVANTVTVNAADTVSTADVSAQLLSRAACCFLETPDSYRKYQGPYFHFFFFNDTATTEIYT